MAIDDLFDHTCDIYHVIGADETPGYGLPTSKRYSYPGVPDLSNIPCHFHVRANYATVKQTQPANIYTADQKLSLPAGTDIRINDKIVDCGTGFEYTANVPKNIRDHHMTTTLRRTSEQEPL